jgi:hypothetical protein
MKLTLLVMLSLFALSSYADKGKNFTNNSKLNSFNAPNYSFISNKTLILEGSEYGFNSARIKTVPKYQVKEGRQKNHPGIQNYSISFLDDNLDVLYQVYLADPYNLYSHDANGSRLIGLKNSPYLEIPIPASIEAVSIRIERLNKEKNESISKLKILK